MRMTRAQRFVVILLLVALRAAPALAQFGQTDPNYADQDDSGIAPGYEWARTLLSYIVAPTIGALIGYFFSEKFARTRIIVLIVVAVVVVIGSLFPWWPLQWLFQIVITGILFLAALGYGFVKGGIPKEPQLLTTHGSAQWADADHLRQNAVTDGVGLVLGTYDDGEVELAISYPGDRHLLTVAPTRAGKGVSAIIPNLLTYEGSAFVIDPKGENTMITAERRRDGLGQKVHVVDPWGLTEATTGIAPACFNPLDWIESETDMGERAMILADSLVVPPPGGSKDPFWDEEAKSLLTGLILYVATDPLERGQRHLGRVRDLLMLPPVAFGKLMGRMLESPQPIVVGTAARTISKEDKLLSNVLSAAQSHTHIFDSQRLRESLSRSDFRFEDLKQGKTTVYLVLPADRLGTFGRWLRLLVQQAIAVTAQNIEAMPDKPILFLLDEMASLGRLSMVEQAYGLMAGFGMQLWGIVQDLSQLNHIYGNGWQTFIGNSGVLQYFGSRDQKTADYFSALCGVRTVNTLSSTFAQAVQGGTTTTSIGEASRKLAMPDELMRLHEGAELLLIENLNPIVARKLVWYRDEPYRALGHNLRPEEQAEEATAETQTA